MESIAFFLIFFLIYEHFTYGRFGSKDSSFCFDNLSVTGLHLRPCRLKGDTSVLQLTLQARDLLLDRLAFLRGLTDAYPQVGHYRQLRILLFPCLYKLLFKFFDTFLAIGIYRLELFEFLTRIMFGLY